MFNRFWIIQTLILISILSKANAQPNLLTPIKEDFHTNIFIETEADNSQHLVAEIFLNDNSYLISPFSIDTIYGHVNLSLGQSNAIKLIGPLSESPLAIEEYDEIIKMKVKYVRVNTRYKREIMVSTQDDTKVHGELWFLLEPQCVPYKVQFTLSQTLGKLLIEEIIKSTDY